MALALTIPTARQAVVGADRVATPEWFRFFTRLAEGSDANPGVVSSRTDLAAIDTTTVTTALLIEDGREGLFVWTAGDFLALVAIDTTEAIYIEADAVAATSGAWVRHYGREISALWFGAVADSTGVGVGTDNTAAFTAFWALVRHLGGTGYIPPGGYRLANSLVWDLEETPYTYQYFEILGAGGHRTSLYFDDDAGFSLYNSAASAAFYKRFGNFEVIGNVPGILMFFGGTTIDGAFNACDLVDVRVVNTSDDPNNIAIQFQFVYGSLIDEIVASCDAGLGTLGTAIRIVACNFCTFRLFPGQALIGSDLYGSSWTVAGNVFLSCDYEVCGTGLLIGDANCMHNTWVGGVFAYNEATDVGIDANAGVNNRFIGFTHGGLGTLWGDTVGVVSDLLGIGYTPGAGEGGAVTQATSKSTGVTLDRAVGEITMHNANLAADTTVSFTLTNSRIGANDVMVLNHVSGGTAGAYALNAQCGAGSASINVRNLTAGTLGEAIVIGFALVRGAVT